MLKQRIITALILAAAFFGALFGLSTLHFAWLMLAALLAAAYEWGLLSGLSKPSTVAFCAAALAAGLLLLHRLGFDPTSGFDPRALVAVCGLAALFWIVVAPLWLGNEWATRNPWVMVPLGLVLIVALWMGMVQLHARSPWLLLGVMFVVWLADTAAYFSGRRFGRRKLAPSISPNKSWEGVYGAMLCVGLYAVLVVMLSRLSTLPTAVRIAIVVLALGLAAISVVGDLFESMMKRKAGVKDSGHTLPGHGGVLDRIDAQFPVLPIAALAPLILARIA